MLFFPIVLAILFLFLASVFLFPELYLELLKRYRKKSSEDYAHEFGYKKMLEDLGPVEPWDYPIELDEETKKR